MILDWCIQTKVYRLHYVNTSMQPVYFFAIAVDKLF